MSESGKAVFLSYASQDADAAKRICDALRARGVEVWFDQNELVGGDAWDQKIRGQIGACALFLPVISANTQARLEGYFRLEWKLAAQRTHTMADEKAFLLPVVVDGTRDAEARVPVEFKAIQWTRLPGGETPASFVARVQRLLENPDGPILLEAGAGVQPLAAPLPAAPRRPKWLLAALGVTVLAIALALILRKSGEPPAPAPAPAAASTPSAPGVAKSSEARELAFRAKAMSIDKYDSSADDYAAADGLVKQALQLDPGDGEIWAVSAVLNRSFGTRGFDRAPERRAAARAHAERAVKLAPDSLEAQYALGYTKRETDPAAAEQLFLKVLAREPNHAGALFGLSTLYNQQDRVDESLAMLKRVAAQPAHEALAQYLAFLTYFARARFVEADAAIRRSVAVGSSANSHAAEAFLLLTWKGRADEAARLLEQVAPANRNEHRVVWSLAYVDLCRRAPDAVLQVLERLPDDYIQDSWFTGPKNYFAGRAHALAGRPEAARVAWEEALASVESRLKAAPENRDLRQMRGELLAFLGRTDEALREARTVTELDRGRYTPWFVAPAKIHAILGRADEAVAELEKVCLAPAGTVLFWPPTSALLRLDPIWDKIRDTAPFQRLLTKLTAREIAALPPRDWPKDPELKRAMQLLDRVDAIPEDFRLAEEIVQRAVKKSPADAEAAAALARTQSMWLLRGWDRSTARFQKAKAIAERALQLAPDEPEALAALSTYIYIRGGDTQYGLQLAQRAVELAPQEPRFYRLRDNTLFFLEFSLSDVLSDQTYARHAASVERALQSAHRTVELFPNDALVRYELARHYRDLGRWPEFEKAADETLALAPVANALVWKARARFGLHDDFAGMKALLDQVPPRVRGIERTVFTYFIYAAFTGDTREALDAINAMSETWLIDFSFRGPRALLLAELFAQQGKKDLARMQYQNALTELQRARAANPDDVENYLDEAWIRHGLGQDEEARAALRVYDDAVARPYLVSPMHSWWFLPIAANLILGDRATALAFMREGCTSLTQGRETLRRRMLLDPRMAPFRDDPEIVALLAEPKAEPGTQNGRTEPAAETKP